MLDAMRKNTKVILWITVVAFLFLMVLVWGAEQQVGCGVSQGVVGRVNGEPIMLDYFNRVYQANRDNFRQGRGSDPGPGDEALLQEQSWTNVLEQVLLIQEAKKRGLAPTDEELKQVALQQPPAIFTSNPNFQTNGQFDQQKYLSLIQSNIEFARQLEAYLRDTLPVEKLQSMVYQGAQVSDDDVRQAFLDRNETVRMTYRLFELRQYTLPATVTDQEAEAWFKAHPEEFQLPPQATVRVAKLERKPTETDLADLRRQLEDFAAIATKAANGDSSAQSFASLAETYSELPSAATGGLSDRFVGPGELTPELETRVMSLPVGGVSEPIQDRQGLHLVQVDSIQVVDGVRKVRFRQLMLAIVPSDATVSTLEEKMTQLRESVTPAKFAELAQAAGLTLTTPPPFADGGFIRGMESVSGPVNWAFQSAVGTVSPVFPTNDAWYLLVLDRRSEKGKPLFADLAEIARQKTTESRQRELARKDAETFLALARNSADWRRAAGADSNQVRTVGPFSKSAGIPGLGRDPEPMGAIFSVGPGAMVGPVNGTRGVLVARIEEKKAADESLLANQKAQLQTQLISQRRNEVYQDWLKNLKASADIKDYRELYFRN
ncbi:MAG: peptidyl-prolyl cis-trans isomerase D [bacterium]|nr:MAG: peptidyl-prolyl cis-trans isomerase D [bacterium]